MSLQAILVSATFGCPELSRVALRGGPRIARFSLDRTEVHSWTLAPSSPARSLLRIGRRRWTIALDVEVDPDPRPRGLRPSRLLDCGCLSSLDRDNVTSGTSWSSVVLTAKQALTIHRPHANSLLTSRMLD